MATEETPIAATTTANVTSPVVQGGDAQPQVASPVVQPADSAATEVDANAPAAPATEPDPNATPVDPNADPAAKPTVLPDWYTRRFNELVGKRHEAERAAKDEKSARLAAEAKAADLLAQIANPNADPANPAKPVFDESEVERRATEKAHAIAAAKIFNDACNNIVEVGKKEYKDWDESLKNLNLVGAIGKDVSPEFLETVVELKNPAAILHHLGQNLEEAERVANLPPKKMALEMARIEAKLNTPAPVVAAPVIPVSTAPAPVIPVSGATKTTPLDINDPGVASADWYELRNKQVLERQGRYRRV